MQCEASLRKLDLSLGIHDNVTINDQSGKFLVRDLDDGFTRHLHQAQPGLPSHIGDDPVRHGESCHGEDISCQEQCSRDQAQLVHYWVFFPFYPCFNCVSVNIILLRGNLLGVKCFSATCVRNGPYHPNVFFSVAMQIRLDQLPPWPVR